MGRVTELESAASGITIRRSNQLSYTRHRGLAGTKARHAACDLADPYPAVKD